KVGCEIDGVDILGQTLEFGDYSFITGQDLVASLPAMIGVDSRAGNQLFTGARLLVGQFLLAAHLAGGGGRLGTFLRVYRPVAAGRQVTDMTHTRLHDKTFTKILVYGL